jgi:transcriptional regulator with XRE-family HTH domain
MRREPLRGLRAIREQRSLSQRDLAAAAGLSVAAIIRLEQGQRHPWPRTAKQLADALGVEPEALYGKAGE